MSLDSLIHRRYRDTEAIPILGLLKPIVQCRAVGVGERGEWERTRVLPEFRCSRWADGEECRALHEAPVGVWLCEVTDPSPKWVDREQSKVLSLGQPRHCWEQRKS